MNTLETTTSVSFASFAERTDSSVRFAADTLAVSYLSEDMINTFIRSHDGGK